jgi:hypothetical protein
MHSQQSDISADFELVVAAQAALKNTVSGSVALRAQGLFGRLQGSL